jgi:predicted NBD/HSP70 family sugar kinase
VERFGKQALIAHENGSRVVVGIDIGGTKIAAGLVNGEGEISHEARPQG